MAVKITRDAPSSQVVALLTAALAGSAIAVAGCGGDSDTGSSAGEVASYVPSSSPLYLEVTTDFDGPQWQQVEALAKQFPGYPDLERMIQEGLRRRTWTSRPRSSRSSASAPRSPGCALPDAGGSRAR